MRLGRYLRFVVSGVVLLFLSIGILIFFIVPGYLESEAIPRFAQKSGIGDVRVDIGRIGLYGADLGSFRIGNEKDPAMTVDSIHLDYTPRGLYHRRLDRVVLSGVTLYGRWDRGRFHVPGLGGILPFSTQPAGKGLPGPMPELPVQKIEIRHGVLSLAWEGKTFLIPFETVLRAEDPHLISGIFHFHPGGRKVSLAARLEMERNILRLSWETEGIPLETFSDLISGIPGLNVAGAAELSGKTEILLSPFTFLSLDSRLSLGKTRIDYRGLRLINAPDSKGAEQPVEVSVKHTEGQAWDLSTNAMSAASPLAFEISELTAGVIPAGEGFSVEGRVFLTAIPGEGGAILENLRLPVNFSLGFSWQGSFEFLLESKAPQEKASPWTLRSQAADALLRGEVPEFRISGKGDAGEITAVLEGKLAGLGFSQGSRSAEIPRLSLEGKAAFDPSSGIGSVSFDVRAPDVKYRDAPLSARLSGLSLEGGTRRTADGDLIADAIIHVRDGQLGDSVLGLSVSGFRGNLPMHLPAGKPGKKGDFFALVRYGSLEMGSITGKIEQQKSGVAFSGRHAGKFFRNLVLDFSGNGEISPLAAKIQWSIPSYVLPTGMDLTPLLPLARGIECGGEVTMEGKGTLSPSGVHASLDLRLKDFNVAHRKQEIAIAGIDMSLHMPELPEMRSAPDQKLSFETATWGKLKVSEGEVGFQVEPGPQLFLEGGEFAWADGHVYVRSMRLSPDMKDIDGTLFCDRLNLAAILKQLGAFDMEGKGAVNGRIPVRISAGKVHIDDGFLYSTPGQGGKIRLTDKDALVGLIPGGAGAIQQLDIAREALKNYEYDWVKIGLATEQDTLVLRMELDGKPADPLPFRYDAESGKFARDPSGKGSRFQGIRLDVNFRLPLDSLMHYGEAMEEMTKIEKLIN